MKTGLHAFDPEVVLAGIEVVTALGYTTEITQREFAAGTLRFAMTSVSDAKGDPVRACVFEPLDALVGPDGDATDRIASLAAMALEAHLPHLERLGHLVADAPILLALPRDRRDVHVDVGRILNRLQSVASASPSAGRHDFGAALVRQHGRSAFFMAIAEAAELLNSGLHAAVIVGAADSQCDAGTLGELADANRPLGDANPDGLLPGEAAGFCVLLRSDIAPPMTSATLRMHGVAIAREPHCFVQDEPNLGDGLTAAFRTLRQHHRMGQGRADHLVSGQPPEGFWAEELTKAYLRNAELMPEPFTFDLVSDGFGDVGAAAGVVQVAMAVAPDLFSADHSPPRVLVYASGDGGEIGASVLEVIATSTTNPQRPPVADGDLTPLVPRLSESQCRELAHELAHEHASEIGFLLDQRGAYLEDDELAWDDMQELEDRILRHLEAWRSWGESGLEWLRQVGLRNSDADILRGCAFGLGSMGFDATDGPLLCQCLSNAEPEARAAIASGLRHARSPWLGHHLEPLLTDDAQDVRITAIELMGYRREGRPTLLLERLRDPSAAIPEKEAIATALAQHSFRPAQLELQRLLFDGMRTSKMLHAALRLGEPSAVEYLREAVRGRTADADAYLLLALVGTPEDAATIMYAWPSEIGLQCAACAALGAIGASESLDTLRAFTGFGDPTLKKAAEAALQRMTGPEQHAGFGTGRFRHGHPIDRGYYLEILISAPQRERILVLQEWAAQDTGTFVIEGDAFVDAQKAWIAAQSGA